MEKVAIKYDFHVGDEVICIAPDSNWLRKGERYTIREQMWEHGLVGLNKFPGMMWWEGRFEPASTVADGVASRGRCKPRATTCREV